MLATTSFMPARVLDSARHELIDQLMNPVASACFLATGDEGSALLAALDDDVARDYFASGCGSINGAWRVFDLLNALDRSIATPSQQATVAAILALASHALNMRAHAHAYLDQVLNIDSRHPVAELILTALDRNIDDYAFRIVASALGSRIEAA